MKPFFSIRIDYNPADSEDQEHRDCFSAKRSVARQMKPCPKFSVDAIKRKKLLRDDTSNVVQAIVHCIQDLKGEARWRLPDLVEDVVFDLANNAGLERQVLDIASIAIDGCEDDFLDGLQKLIDSERKKREQP
jgi:hypothetical protein